jgi:hypothetical protein
MDKKFQVFKREAAERRTRRDRRSSNRRGFDGVNNSTLQTLNLQYNQLGEIGGPAIGEALKVNSTLRELELKSLGETAGQAIGKALKVNSTPHTLNCLDDEDDDEEEEG